MKQADILRFYLQVNGLGDMKMPAAEKMSCSGEQRRRLPPASIRTRKRPSCLIAQAQAFPLALNPTQKAAVLSFMVNEQLQNKAVIGQIDGAIEGQDTTRRDRWIVDSKIKKLKDLTLKKFLHSEETPQFVRLVDEFDGRQSRSLGRLYDTRRDDPFGQRRQQEKEAAETEEHPEETSSEAYDSAESPTR